MSNPPTPQAILEKVRKKKPIEILLAVVLANAKGQIKKYHKVDSLDDAFIVDQAIDTLDLIESYEALYKENERMKHWVQSVSVFFQMENKTRINGEIIFDEEKVAKWLEHIEKNLLPQVSDHQKNRTYKSIKDPLYE